MSITFARLGALAGGGVVSSLLLAPLAFGACVLPTGTTPGRCNYSGIGFGLSIQDTNSDATRTPVTIKGAATGRGGVGLWGVAAAQDGVGIVGLNTGISGNAARFRITNNTNLSPVVAIATDAGTATGDPSYGLRVVDNGVGIAGHFVYNNTTRSAAGAAVLAVNAAGQRQTRCGDGVPCGHYGAAGIFEITNPNNADDALQVGTNGVAGTALLAAATGAGSNSIAVSANDETRGGGTAVYGKSRRGNSAYFIGGSGNPKGSVYFDGGGSWNFASDRRLKDHFAEVDPGVVLDQLGAMPVYYYQAKGAILPTRYLGPTAQDFKSAFGLGASDTSINEANAVGVALTAAKGLLSRVKADETEIAALKAQLAAERAAAAKIGQQEARLTQLEAALAALRAPRSAASGSAAVVR